MSTSTVNPATQQVRAGFVVPDGQRVSGGGNRPAIDGQHGWLPALDGWCIPTRWARRCRCCGGHSSRLISSPQTYSAKVSKYLLSWFGVC